MDRGTRFLSDLVLNRTYAAVKPDGYKETTEEVVDRVLNHHIDKYPSLKNEILNLRTHLVEGRVVPAMRWMQFAGEGIKRNNIRGFNCSYLAIESFQDFAEIFYILMCGSGVGYSVKRRHINKLPRIPAGHKQTFSISDDKEGWADSVAALLNNPQVTFDYSPIRPKGAPLSTGGTASGSEALKLLHERIRGIIDGKEWLSPLDAHDIACCIADGVVVGGVRRAALIALFDADDEDMLTCKHGQWWETTPWRGRANNSAVINRNDPDAAEKFDQVMTACFNSNCGEPGIAWTNDDDWGGNPCFEIGLRPKQMCNLSEVNVAACKGFKELVEAVQAAAILGTLQASYTDFPYIDKKWRENCEEEALLGVSLTGLAEAWEKIEHGPALKYLSELAGSANKLWSQKLGINPAARITCVKPSGTASAFLGTTSGIHAAHAPYYIRRVRIDVDHPVSRHLVDILDPTFIEKDLFNSENYVVSIPVKMEGSIMRDEETALQLMNRARYIAQHWVLPGHHSGKNTHNVSMTVSYKEKEKEWIMDWMWENRELYTGISLLPFDGHVYQQAPFEAITEEQYNELFARFPDIDLSKVRYVDVMDDRQGEAACAGGQCVWGA